MTIAADLVSKRGLDVAEVIDRLNSFHAQNTVNALWAGAVANRAEGSVLFLLSAELDEVAADARAAAETLAARIGDLGGAITADPSDLITRSVTGSFSLPDNCADVKSILDTAAASLDAMIDAYQEFLDLVRGIDDVSHAIVVKLLAHELHRRADIEATLAR